MRTCAYAHGYPPICYFFIYILFSGGRFPLFCRFFAVRELFSGCFGRVCVVCYSVFFLGVCVLFFDSGFVWEFVWRFGFVLRDFSDVGENDGCQCESVQIEGVLGVMSGIFGVELKGSCSLRGDVSEPIVYLFTRFYEINTAFYRKKR